jgi:hypothetical protein
MATPTTREGTDKTMQIDLSQFEEKNEEPDFLIAHGRNEYAERILVIFASRAELNESIAELGDEAEKQGLLLSRIDNHYITLKEKEGLLTYLVSQIEEAGHTVKAVKLAEWGKSLMVAKMQLFRVGDRVATEVEALKALDMNKLSRVDTWARERRL